jgi:uncharacterized protein
MRGHTATPEDVFLRLIDGISRLVHGDLSQVDALADLHAESTHVTLPMAQNGPVLTTREELRRFYTEAVDLVRGIRFRAEDIRILHTTDPEVIVAEFVYKGPAPAKPLVSRCVHVMRVRNGLIVESRNYVDHAAFARARGD